MTDAAKLVKPTQADRDAAGEIFRSIGRDQSARLAELGRGGDGPVTLIIARHRIEALTTRNAELEAERDAGGRGKF